MFNKSPQVQAEKPATVSSVMDDTRYDSLESLSDTPKPTDDYRIHKMIKRNGKHSALRVLALVVFLIFFLMLVFWVSSKGEQSQNVKVASVPSNQPRGVFNDSADTRQIEVNSPLQTNNSFVLNPAERPTEPKKGQIYFDKLQNQFFFYTGTAWSPLKEALPASPPLALSLQKISAGDVSLVGQVGQVNIGLSGSTITFGLDNNGVVAGKYNNVVIDTTGRVTTGTDEPYLLTELDGLVGNELLDVTINGGLSRSGAGTTASPYTVGLRADCATSQSLSYTGLAWTCSNAGTGDILQGGNTFPSTDVTIGTNNAQSLNLETNGIARLTIDPIGNVGIGTISPSAKLTVEGGILTNNGLVVVNGNTGINAATIFQLSGTNNGLVGIAGTNGYLINQSLAGDLALRSDGATSKILLSTDAGSTTTLAVSGGNVGIGTTTPQRRLVVQSDDSGGTTNTALYNADTTNNNRVILSFRTDTTGIGASTFYEVAGIRSMTTDHNHATRNTNLEFFAFDSSGANTMVLLGNGNVGIGTSTPTQKLEVSDTSAETSIKITNLTGEASLLLDPGSVGATWRINANEDSSLLRFIQDGAGTRLSITEGDVGIGSSLLGGSLIIDAGLANSNYSGLRFDRLSSLSPAGASSGKVLSVNASGEVILEASGGVLGSGTNNYVARWTPNGATLGVGALQDNGTQVGINTTPIFGNGAALDINGVAIAIGTTVPNSGAAGYIRYRDDTGTSRYGLGILGTAGETRFQLIDSIAGVERLTVDSSGFVGIGTASPASLLSNTAINIAGVNGAGIAYGGLTWATGVTGYTQALYNSSNVATAGGLLVKIAGTASTNIALDVSQGPTQINGGTSIFRVNGDGTAGFNTANISTGDVLTIGSKTTGISGGLRINASDFSTNGGTLLINKSNGTGTMATIQAGDNITYGSLALNPEGGNVTIGVLNSGSDSLLILDDKTTAGDPTGINGATYYNSSLSKFRCYQGGAWLDCIGSGLGTGDILQNGNTLGAAVTIGTNDVQPLNLETSGTARLTVTSTGNVGIGTTTPAARLSIANTTYGWNDYLQFTDGTRSAQIGIVSAGGAIGFRTGAATPTGDAYDYYGSDGSTRLLTITNDGRVGIGVGTTTPTQKLEVSGAASTRVRVTSTTDSDTGFEIYADGSFKGGMLYDSFSGLNGLYGPLSTAIATLSSAGNFGIGTGVSAPNSKLEVNSGVANTSGIRLSQLTSASTAGASSGKVLSVNASGDVVLEAAGGGVSGSGTTNYVARWTPNGNTLGVGSLYDDGTNVGIGTAAPGSKLEVVGALANSNSYTLFSNSLSTSTTGSIGSYNRNEVNPTSVPLGSYGYYGSLNAVVSTGSNTNNNTYLYASVDSSFNTSSSAVGYAYGSLGIAGNSSSSLLTNAYATSGRVDVLGSGNINSASALSASAPLLSGTGIINTLYGLNIEPQKVAGVTNGYGVYQAGATDLNYFAGSVSIGHAASASSAYLSVNNSGLIGTANQPTYDVGAGRFGAGRSIYSYGTICAGNQNADCTGTGGVVLSISGIANNAAIVNIVDNGFSPITFQGATQDAFYTTLSITDPTVNNVITLPNASGVVCLDTGNCGTGTVSGAGTTNYLARWTPNGTTLGVGQIQDDGTYVGIGVTPNPFPLALGIKKLSVAGSILAITSTDTDIALGAHNSASNRGFNIYQLSSTDTSPNAILFEQFNGVSYTRPVTIDQTGNLGVGTIAPTQKLEVAGNIKGDRFIGYGAGGVTSNSAVGLDSLMANTTGYYNSAFGFRSLEGNTTGYYNSAYGVSSLQYNTIGSGNTASGGNSLAFNSSGSNNTATGYLSLYLNTTGTDNTALGVSSLRSNTTGIYNAALGANTLYSNISGNWNTASGMQSLYSNVSGEGNVANGYLALSGNVVGNHNTALGTSSLTVSTGSYNVAVGSNSLANNTTASQNTSVGRTSLFDVTTGNNNTAIGYDTGLGITTGNYNTILGANVGGLAANLSNNIIIADGQGNQRINVVANGNVGIGSNAPLNKLVVWDSAPVAALAVVSGNSSQTGLVLADIGANVGGGVGLEFTYNSLTTSNSQNIARIMPYTQLGGGGDLLFQTAASGTAPYDTKLALTRAGNFGVGTSTPAYKLVVVDVQSASSGVQAGQVINQTFTPTTTNYTTQVNGLKVESLLSAATAVSTNSVDGNLRAILADAPTQANQNIFGTYGITGSSGISSGSGSISNAYGTHGFVYQNAQGTIDNAFGDFSEVRSTGAGTINRAVGYYGDLSKTAGTIGNYTLLKAADYSSVVGAGNQYGVLTYGNSRFGDNTYPTEVLEVAGNLKTTGTLKFANGANNLTVSSVATAARSIVCLSIGNCPSGLGTGDVLQNGNSFGATLTLGTNDNQKLALETNGITRVTILTSGNVGIGVATPTAKLDVGGTLNAAGNATFRQNVTVTGTSNFTGNGFFAADAFVTGTLVQGAASNCSLSASAFGQIICTSDENLKNVSGSYSGGLTALRSIVPINFNYVGESYQKVGFSAQNVQSVLPQATPLQSNGFLGLDANAITALLVNSVKEIDVKLSLAEARLAQLQVASTPTFAGLIVNGNIAAQSLSVTATLTANQIVALSGITTGNITTTGLLPTVIGLPAAGQGATVTIEGNDTAGSIVITSGIDGNTALSQLVLAIGDQAQVNFVTAKASVPRVIVSPTSDAAAQIAWRVEKTTTGFKIKFLSAPVASTNYSFDYVVIQ
jgi:hypothetical protein